MLAQYLALFLLAHDIARGDEERFELFEPLRAAVRDRTLDAIARVDAERLVVVTHATVIRVVVTALLDLPARTYRARFGRPGHLSRTELERHAGGWRLLAYSADLPTTGA